jgi:ketosteroid isomerase-like protein
MNKNIFYDFIHAINEHDIDKICLLMSNDHAFIDSQGNEVTGKDKMKDGWIGYFNLFPDYTIEITDIFANSNTYAAFGFASGTYKGLKSIKNKNNWKLPASWKAIIENDKIKLWQVYADSKIPFDIIENAKDNI